MITVLIIVLPGAHGRVPEAEADGVADDGVEGVAELEAEAGAEGLGGVLGLVLLVLLVLWLVGALGVGPVTHV